MKKTQLVILVVIVIAIGAIIATISDASTYVSFSMASENPGTKYTVIGYLDKDGEMNYNARAQKFTFIAIDKEGEKKKVMYGQPKPQDFERSEEITMKGYSTDSLFVAEEILMKCPSKYNEQNEIEGYNTY